MMKRKGSLLRQLTLGLGLAIVFLSLASFYYQYQVQKHILTASIEGDLTRQAMLLREWIGTDGTSEDRQAIARNYARLLDRSVQQLTVVNRDSKVIATTSDQEPGADFSDPLLSEVFSNNITPDGVARMVGNCYAIALPIYSSPDNKNVAGAILLRQPLSTVDELADSLMMNAFILLASTLVLIVAVVYYVLRQKVHKPMQAIFMQEYRIREGDLAKIEGEDPANEFSDLYAMYNEMVVRLAEQRKALLEQKDHVALANLVRQAINRLTAPLDDILTKSRVLLDSKSSLSEEERSTLKLIIANITRIARELKSMIVEGDKSSTALKREADKLRDFPSIETNQPSDS